MRPSIQPLEKPLKPILKTGLLTAVIVLNNYEICDMSLTERAFEWIRLQSRKILFQEAIGVIINL